MERTALHFLVLRRVFFLFLTLLWWSAFSANVSWAVDQIAPEMVPGIEIASDQIDSTLAKLSDEQVRGLLLTELARGSETNAVEPSRDGMLYKARNLLHMLNRDDTGNEKSVGVLSTLSGIFSDVAKAGRVIGNGSLSGFLLAVVLFGLVFGAAYLVELSLCRFTGNFSKQFQDNAIPDLDGPMRFVAGIMRAVPAFIHILVYAVVALVFFLLLPGSGQAPRQYLFLAILVTLVFGRFLNQFSRIVCAPEVPSLRLVAMDDRTAASLHRTILLLCTYTCGAVMFVALLMELQFSKSSVVLGSLCVTSVLVVMIVFVIFRSRNAVKERILQQSEKNKTRNWVVEQFAQFWHVPAVLYFIIIWLILVNSKLSGLEGGRSAFLLSLLVLPLFLFFDWVGQWVVRGAVHGLGMYDPDAEKDVDEEKRLQLAEAKEQQRKIGVTAGRSVRLAILVALLIWVANLWGYRIPYAPDIAGAVFQSLIALALGLTAWRFISSYLEKKIAEATPEEEEESTDDEFGGAAQRGRGYTLLPLIRKVVASILLVMVSLVILSSLGVDIGPLLAGAGVVGLAVGFGAQKLVSDVFSGFFYLLDDAFRVGEYIEAGPVSGAVESITLRNVMLRHHRGMLQIVPHSDLGSITNFMRGGIIVKFNLDFPYDADVEKIRKVIKKVGKAMLKDEEFSKDFINPVKSAGVREITGSVMTIRVKFKAQPGTHFVIRREAYRRITEALKAQGIHYAHRKVIVELPEDKKGSSVQEREQLLEAGAAAALTQLEEDEKKAAASQNSSKPGMPGM